MELKDIPITRLIPQRPPFVMVDRLLTCDERDAVTEFTVTPDCLFAQADGHLAAAGLVEHLAQSCAARMGCLDSQRGEPVKIGYIGDIRACHIVRYPRLGETLHTLVHIVEEVFNLTLADVTTEVGGEPVATARIKIAMTDVVPEG